MTTKAIAVIPGRPNSLHLATSPKPSVHDIPNEPGVLVQVLRVGVDGTDKEINAAEYGAAPPGEEFFVIGHECLGSVMEVGRHVSELIPGDYVFPTLRRPGSSAWPSCGNEESVQDARNRRVRSEARRL
ncbi:MAG: alcohol dehydrogenase catalytic domain-containing protein [Nitrospira sp.]|nr:alcohol dehydrogenase catalytic domain-containing protein [Nitrospira sp.]